MDTYCLVNFVSADCTPNNNDNNTVREEYVGRILPKNLIYMGKKCQHFRLSVCLSNDMTTTSATFYKNNVTDCFAELDFYRNEDLLSGGLRGSRRPNQFRSCAHFEAVDADGAHNTLSVCDVATASGLFRLGGRAYQLDYLANQRSFGLTSIADDLNGRSACVALRSAHKELAAQRRRRRAAAQTDDERPMGGETTTTPPFPLPNYYRQYLDGVRRYVELVFVSDHSIYLKYEKNAAKIHDRMQSIAGIVNSLYAPINVRVTLVWADIWMAADAIEVNSDAGRTLERFSAYRKSQLLADHPHDNAHLITDVRFGEVIGKAYRGTMCSYSYSIGVIVDHSPNVAFVGGTVAHEMGHNLGMDHDSGYPEPCACAAQQCIMAPASSNVNVSTYFSDCSLVALDAALRRGVDYCLRNVPEAAFGGAKCGNGVLEPGEECDCGSTKLCLNRCCVAATCRLATNAECADGDCCDIQTCKPKPMARLCRNATNSCDLPEYCDGRNPICPPDFFVQNGLECPDDSEALCYDGHCGSRVQQCQRIWGPTASNSVKRCYAYNRDGTFSGNCGYDQHKNRYLPCLDEDVECGRLKCDNTAERPTFGDPSAVFSTYDGREAACRSVRTTYTGSGGRSGKMRDPGMVPDGAKCGLGKMCLEARCRNHSEVTQMVTTCEPIGCNGKGICNNVGNCHCIPGYGGPGCDIPGFGGSLNSGPATDHMFNPGVVLAYLILVGLIVFAFATYYCKRHKDYWLHKKIWKTVRNTLNIRSNVRVPVRRAPPIPGVSIQHTHRFSFNALWGDSPPKNAVVTVPASTVVTYSAPVIATRPLAATSSTAALLSVGPLTAEPAVGQIDGPTAMHNVHQQRHIWTNPVTLENTRGTISPSTSSSSDNGPEMNEKRPLQNMVSNRKLMEDIKRAIDQPSSTEIHSSQLAGALRNVKWTKKQRPPLNGGGASTSALDNGRTVEAPPPPPPHRNRGDGPPTPPKKPQPKGLDKIQFPQSASSAHNAASDSGMVAARLAQLEGASKLAKNKKSAAEANEDKPLSVQQLTAKFDSAK